MRITQVYQIVNEVAKQMQGEKAVEVVDLKTLINLGDTIYSSQTNKENFLNTLVDRIYQTIISTRAYSPRVKDMVRYSAEFGAVLQKIYVEPIESQASTTWDLQDGGSVDQYVINKPQASQKLFSGINVWQAKVTIPDIQMKSAFTSSESMSAFIDAIFTALQNSMNIRLEGMVNMTYNNFIGSRLVHTKINGGHTVIDLLGDYNRITGGTLTAAKAMYDLGFLTYATTQIKLYISRFESPSRLFNQEDYLRHTPKDYNRVTMLSDFIANVDSTLRANTFHQELVALPLYTEVPFWQGTGEEWSFANSSTINIETSDGYGVNQTGIIGMMTDIEALGVMLENERMTSANNTEGEYTNFVSKADMGYFNDLSENGIVFVVADTINTPTAPTP